MQNSTNKKTGLAILLITQTSILIFYTIYVGINEGWNFLEVGQSNIVSLTWNGQFSLDFSCYLLLSAIWIMWRDNYSLQSIIIAVLAMIIGIIVFAPYVLYLLWREKNNLYRVLLGERAMST